MTFLRFETRLKTLQAKRPAARQVRAQGLQDQIRNHQAHLHKHDEDLHRHESIKATASLLFFARELLRLVHESQQLHRIKTSTKARVWALNTETQ